MTLWSRFLRRYGHVLDVLCIAAIPVTIVRAPHLVPLSGISAGAMILQDFFGTMLTKAESLGRSELAGEADRHFTLARVIVYSYSAEQLAHHGAAGWIALMPTLLADRHLTGLFTKLARRMKPYEEQSQPQPKGSKPMSFFLNFGGHVDEALHDAEVIEHELVGRLQSVVAEFVDHITQASFSGSKVGTVNLLAAAKPPADPPVAATPTSAPVETTTVATGADATTPASTAAGAAPAAEAPAPTPAPSAPETPPAAAGSSWTPTPVA